MHKCNSVVGCMVASVSFINQGIDASVCRVGCDADVTVSCIVCNGIEATASRVGKGLVVQASLVCYVAEVVDTHIPFLVKEGAFILVDGKEFKVLRYELSE